MGILLDFCLPEQAKEDTDFLFLEGAVAPGDEPVFISSFLTNYRPRLD